jgi:aminopeptidase N
VLDVSYQWDESAKKVVLHATQTQKTSEWVPVFQMPVMIGITTASGKESHKVWIRKRGEHFEFACPEKPLLVRFDEGNHLLKEMNFPKPIDELAFQLQHDDVVGRMWAASQLSSHPEDAKAIAALRQSAAGDPFWAVREKALVALTPALGAGDVTFLKERALDPKSKVRAAALRALGNRHDPSLSPYFQRRYNQDASYVAEAAALRAIGQSGDSAAIAFLQAAGQEKSPRDMLHTAAEEAIKMVQK